MAFKYVSVVGADLHVLVYNTLDLGMKLIPLPSVNLVLDTVQFKP